MLRPATVEVPEALVETLVKRRSAKEPVAEAAGAKELSVKELASPVAVEPETVTLACAVKTEEKVLAPARVWVPVVINPRLLAEASGMLRVTVPPKLTGEPETLKSEPEVPVATVIEPEVKSEELIWPVELITEVPL
jgi:hypothetical protein